MNARLGLQSSPMLMNRKPVSALLTLLALAASTGCSMSGQPERQPLELEGPVAVEINTFAGDVEVRAVDPGSGGSAYVQVTRSIKYGNRTGNSGNAFEQIEWTTEIDRDERGPVLVVNVTTRENAPHSMWGHVLVEVPIVDGVRVHTTRGDVSVNEVSGPVELITSDGSVELMSDQPLLGPVKILTSEGDVNVRLAPGSKGTLDFFAKDGRVGLHVKNGRMQVAPGTSNDSLHGVLNDGVQPFVIRTTHGVIRFTVKHRPKMHGIFHLD